MNHEHKIMWMKDLNQLISTLNALKESDRRMKRMFLHCKKQNAESIDYDGENMITSYNGKGIPFEADASPYTFEAVYPTLYHDDLQDGVLTLKLDFLWKPSPVSVKKGNMLFKRYIIKRVIKENLAYKLSGDTDFNFKEGKYESYSKKFTLNQRMRPFMICWPCLKVSGIEVIHKKEGFRQHYILRF